MHNIINNNSAKLSFRALIVGLILAIVLAGTGFLLLPNKIQEVQKTQEIQEVQKTSSGLMGIQIPVKYNQPLVISTLDKVLRISPVRAAAAEVVQMGENAIKYIDAYSNTDVEQIRMPNKLKESLILKGPNHPTRFEYQINIEDYKWEIDADQNIIFQDKNPRDFSQLKSDTGKIVPEFISRNHLDEHAKIFKIPKPFMVEVRESVNIENLEDIEDKGEVKVKIQGNKLILIPDPEWIKTHTYPILVDPTIVRLPQPVEEVSSKRTPTGITFRNDDGSFTFSTQLGNYIHYYDDQGNLQPVDTTIQTDEQGRHYVKKVPYYQGEALDNPAYLIQRKDGSYVQEELLNTDGTTNFSQTGVIEGNKKVFKDVFTDTDFEVEFKSSGLKGNVILKSADAPRVFEFKLSSNQESAEINATGKKAGKSTGKDKLQKIDFGELHVFAKAWDANPNPDWPEDPQEWEDYERIPLIITFDKKEGVMTVEVG